MARTIETTVYTFAELSDRAKETARNWWREQVYSDSSDWEFTYDDAERVGALIGIEIDRRTYKTMGGGTGSEPAIYFSGFSSQGDGACFEGSYSYVKGALKALKKEIGSESKGDKELIRIATALQALQRRHFYQLEARMKHRGHYYHAYCMDVDVTMGENYPPATTEDEVRQLMRDFANWIYRQLEAEYEYKMSDAAVDESLIANEYEFDEDGNIN